MAKRFGFFRSDATDWRCWCARDLGPPRVVGRVSAFRLSVLNSPVFILLFFKLFYLLVYLFFCALHSFSLLVGFNAVPSVSSWIHRSLCYFLNRIFNKLYSFLFFKLSVTNPSSNTTTNTNETLLSLFGQQVFDLFFHGALTRAPDCITWWEKQTKNKQTKRKNFPFGPVHDIFTVRTMRLFRRFNFWYTFYFFFRYSKFFFGVSLCFSFIFYWFFVLFSLIFASQIPMP